jgi:hypothetical protein
MKATVLFLDRLSPGPLMGGYLPLSTGGRRFGNQKLPVARHCPKLPGTCLLI